jgi:hypothetical protein
MELERGIYFSIGEGVSRRVAFVNSTIRAGLYGLYSESLGTDEDFILANVDMVGGLNSHEATMRPQSVSRFVVVDSRVRNDPAVGPNFAIRLHEDVSDVFLANNQLELTNAGIWLDTYGHRGTYSDVRNVVIRGNRAYRDTVQVAWHSEVHITNRGGQRVMDVIIEDNELWLPEGSGNMFWQMTGEPALRQTLSNNTGSVYTSTPFFAGGADH